MLLPRGGRYYCYDDVFLTWLWTGTNGGLSEDILKGILCVNSRSEGQFPTQVKYCDPMCVPYYPVGFFEEFICWHWRCLLSMMRWCAISTCCDGRRAFRRNDFDKAVRQVGHVQSSCQCIPSFKFIHRKKVLVVVPFTYVLLNFSSVGPHSTLDCIWISGYRVRYSFIPPQPTVSSASSPSHLLVCFG